MESSLLTTSPQYRARLRAQLLASFDAGEFKVLCADIGVNYDTVPGEEIESRAHGLITKLVRRGELVRLTDYCARLRPHLNWQEQTEEREQANSLAVLDEIETPPPPKPDQPPQTAIFTGREAELAQYASHLVETHMAIICGFAGVGKTALAAALARRASTPEKTFWHSFHADEGMDVILWKLAAFLAWQGQAELWRTLNNARQTGGQVQPPQVLLDYLMPRLSGQGFVLCLDDYHLVADDPLVQQVVQRLRGLLGAGELSLIITSREMPEFAESALVTPLRGFNVADTQALLAQRGLSLSAALVAELHTRTEGNAQFLTLAINALQRTTSPERFILRLAEATDIERYFLREIDRDLSDDERAAMGAVAILLGYPGTRDALDAVLDGGLARRTLNELSERFLLVMSEGATGKEFAQHAIVQAFYYDQLSKRERQTLHLRAGEFYGREEVDALKAALHFERAGDGVRAASWATTHLSALINQGQAHTVQKLLERLKVQPLDGPNQALVNEAHGDIQFLFGEFDAALSDYAVAERMNNDDGLAQARLQRKQGEVLYRQSAFEESLAAFMHGRALLAERPDAVQETGQLAVGYGSTLLALGRYDEALAEAWRGLVQLPETQLQPDIEANLCDLIGKVAFYKGDFGESLVQFQTALTLRQGIADLRGVIKSYSNVAVVYGQQNRYEEAMRANESALEIAERIGDTVALGMLYNNIASDFAESGEYDKAIDFHQRSLSLSEKANDRSGVSTAHQNLGQIYRLTKLFDQSVLHLTQAVELAKRIGAEDLILTTTTMLAETHLAQGRIDESLAECTDALRRSDMISNMSFRPTCLDLLGRIYSSMKRWSEARQCFAEAIKLQQDQETAEDLVNTYLHWSQLERLAGESNRAQELCDKATDKAIECKSESLRKQIDELCFSSAADTAKEPT